jgi:transposase
MLIFSVVLLLDNAFPHTAALTWALLEHFNWELFDQPPYNPDFSATTTCLPTWRIGWYHSISTIMSSRWKVSKHGWAHRQQTSLTQAYKILLPDTSVSIPAVSTLRSSLSMYVRGWEL